MMFWLYRVAIATIALTMGAAVSATAAEWQWPSQMNIGGFSVTGVGGSTRSDGSGSARGNLQIPGFGSHKVELSRSARGDVTGKASIDGRGQAAAIKGSFTLSDGGLRGQGTIDTSPRPIDNASIVFNSGGQASGSGRVRVGSSSANVDYSISGGSLTVNGSTSVRDKVSTALAAYEFSGTVKLQGASSRIAASASGKVVRTGKLADQATSYNVSNAPVDLASGRCSVNIGGVNVEFKF